VSSWEVDTAGFDEEERSSIDAHRWWSAAELDRTTEMFFPRELSSLLSRVTAC
jgi:hypothetical protein